MHGPEPASNTCLGNVVPKEGFSANQTHQTASNSNILSVYKPIGLEEACGDINNLPSLKAGMKVGATGKTLMKRDLAILSEFLGRVSSAHYNCC